MNIQKQIIFIFIFTFYCYGNNTLIVDSYRNKLSQILIDTSNSIDCFFIDENDSLSSTTHAEFSTSIVKETYLAQEKDIRFKIRVNLPKIQKNLKLIIEDEHSDDILYDETQLESAVLKDKRYYARIEFLTTEFKNLESKLSLGTRIQSQHLVPYVNHYVNYKVYESKKLQSNFSNHFRFYSDGKVEDYLDLSSVYKYGEALFGVWRNTLGYDESHFQTFFMDYSLIHKFDSKKQLTMGMGATSFLKNFKDSKNDNFNLHTSFFHIFHKNWMYYEIAPSILKRDLNGYKTSYRLFLNFGIYFNADS